MKLPPPTLAHLEQTIDEKLGEDDGMAALRMAEQAVEFHTTDPVAHYLLGMVLEKIGQYKHALGAYRACLEAGGYSDVAQRISLLSATLAIPAQQSIPTPARGGRSGLDLAAQASIQIAVHNFRYKGVSRLPPPFDLDLYTQLLGELKPRTILEISSRADGSVRWMADLCDAMDIECEIYSMDSARIPDMNHSSFTWDERDSRHPGAIWSVEMLATLPRPWLVIEDADHSYETSAAVLEFFDFLLTPEDIFVIDFGIVSDLAQLVGGTSAPNRALREFIEKRFFEWKILAEYCDFDAANFSGCSNVFLRKTGIEKFAKDVAPDLTNFIERITNEEFAGVLADLDLLKGSGKASRGADYLKALCFWKIDRPIDALEAAKEELRWFPDHAQACRLADYLTAKWVLPPSLGNDEFRQLCLSVRPYTMLSEERLYSLYRLAHRVCVFDIPGDFVECGVAGGGSSALLATVIARHSKRPRRLFACDTFSGMPAPTSEDLHGELLAKDSGWGAGTCAAPIRSLMEVCEKLGVASFVTPVQGLFSDTLPSLSDSLEDIAFLHMDGDWFESTRDILLNLYDRVRDLAPIQVDDYGYWQGCREALHQFEQQRGLAFNIHVVDGTGVWFSKPASSTHVPQMLNLGCGHRVHPAWLNLDIAPTDPSVIAHDLTESIPLDDGSCLAVYNSHVLEHLPREDAPEFLAECFRVLMPGGILRVVVPDLETIARLYLRNLDDAASGDIQAEERHEWMTIELVDQLARHRSGGQMLDYWKKDPMPAEDFVYERMGGEARNVTTALRTSEQGIQAAQVRHSAADVGHFRIGGEVHQWMYDRVSLAKMLNTAGFVEIRSCKASESSIQGWPNYHLDTDELGQTRKPDSLFIEARKQE